MSLDSKDRKSAIKQAHKIFDVPDELSSRFEREFEDAYIEAEEKAEHHFKQLRDSIELGRFPATVLIGRSYQYMSDIGPLLTDLKDTSKNEWLAKAKLLGKIFGIFFGTCFYGLASCPIPTLTEKAEKYAQATIDLSHILAESLKKLGKKVNQNEIRKALKGHFGRNRKKYGLQPLQNRLFEKIIAQF